MYTTFYIKIDGGNNVIQYSKLSKPGWLMVSVDKSHLDNFKNNYTDYQYDSVRGGLLPPDGVTTDQEIPNIVQLMSTSSNSDGKGVDVNSLNSNINQKANQKDLDNLTSAVNSVNNNISNISKNLKNTNTKGSNAVNLNPINNKLDSLNSRLNKMKLNGLKIKDLENN